MPLPYSAHRKAPPVATGSRTTGDKLLDAVVRRSEILMLLWVELGLESECANPALLSSISRELRGDGSIAALLLGNIGKSYSLSAILAELAHASTGDCKLPEFRLLWECLGDLERAMGRALRERTGNERSVARRFITGLLDKQRDLLVVRDDTNGIARLCRGPIASAVDVILCPSLWLPAPQRGRHSAVVRQEGKTTVLLWFGVPGHASPSRMNITTEFLRDGALVMWLRTFLNLACAWNDNDLIRALRPLMPRAVGTGLRFRSARELIQRHLGVVVQAHFYSCMGGDPESVRDMALAQGYWLFDWFRADLDSCPVAGDTTEWLENLPSRIEAERQQINSTWKPPRIQSTKASVLFVEALQAGKVVFHVPPEASNASMKLLRRRWSSTPAELRAGPKGIPVTAAPSGYRRGVISVKIAEESSARSSGKPFVRLLHISKTRRSWHMEAVVPHRRFVDLVSPELFAGSGGE